MKIVLVLTTGEGGIPHYTAELANSLSVKKNYNISVVLPEETTADDFFSNSVTLYRWFKNPEVSFSRISSLDISPAKIIRSATSFNNAENLDSLDPDVVHFTHKPHSYVRPFITNIDVGCPIVETRHETENSHLLQLPGRDLPWQEDLVTTGARNIDSFLRHIISGVQADGHIVHTEKNKEDILDKYPCRKVRKIPHGAFTIFGESTVTPSDPYTLLFFGNITGAKGLSQVVESTIEISEDLDEITTIIAGSGKIPDSVEDRIKMNPDHFNLKNEFIPDEMVSELFTRASAVIIPHREQQGHSGTMTIAFSHGKPIIATNVGEYDELVRRSGSGYIVEPDDVKGMKNAIFGLLTNEELRQKMGENSKDMGEQLSWEKVADKTTEYYEQLKRNDI